MKLHVRILLGMILGIVLGVSFGPQGAFWRLDQIDAVDGSLEVYAAPSADAPLLGISPRSANLLGPGPDGWHAVEVSLSPEVATRGFVRLDGEALVRSSTHGHLAVFCTEWIGRLFLAMIKMVVVPLVLLSLVVGVASLGDLRSLGRLGGRTLLYFTATTAVAISIGVLLAVTVRPGAWVPQADRERLLATYASEAAKRADAASSAPSFLDQLVLLVPENPLAAMVKADMLQIIVFALLLGVALTWMPPDRARPVVDLFDRLNEAMVALVHLAMQLAPFGVAALLFKLAGSTGSSVLIALAGYVLVVVGGLVLQGALVYAPVVVFGGGISLGRFLRGLREALLLAFSTSSSSATLPVTKANCEENLGVGPRITSFVLPLGATVNMDGTALYQGVATVFIAQILGIDLTWLELATVVGAATLASIGAAGVPGAGMITLVLVLSSLGIPVEGLALILGVDRLLDMFRTTINVMGDATAAVWMARLEGELRPPTAS
jgi:Na+/H+-dicarboxylate symporter